MGPELGKGRDAGGWPADPSAADEEDHHQLVASGALPPGVFQLLVRLVLPEGRRRGQVQKTKFLVAAPTQALPQDVSRQTEATWCS